MRNVTIVMPQIPHNSREVIVKVQDGNLFVYIKDEQGNTLVSKADTVTETRDERDDLARAICNSEAFMWLMVGANHPEAHRMALRDAWRAYSQAGGGWGNNGGMRLRIHKEGCCTNADGTWSESEECDAECWCHVPVPEHHEEPPTYDPRAAGTVYPTDTVKPIEHGAQEYISQAVPISLGVSTRIDRCKGCGVFVGDRDQHDYSHSKGRSQV
jgi:DNA polymerase IIIc chi subunit